MIPTLGARFPEGFSTLRCLGWGERIASGEVKVETDKAAGAWDYASVFVRKCKQLWYWVVFLFVSLIPMVVTNKERCRGI